MLKTFGIRGAPPPLLPHVLAFAKGISLLVQARQVYVFCSLLLSYFSEMLRRDIIIMYKLCQFLVSINNMVDFVPYQRIFA